MLGTRVLAGSTSGTTKFSKLCFGTSSIASIRTTTITSLETTHPPSIGTTGTETSVRLHSYSRGINEPESVNYARASGHIPPDYKVVLNPKEKIIISRSNYVAYSWTTFRRGYASYSAVLDFGEVPTPKGLPYIGTTLSLILAGGPKKLHKYIDRRHRDLGTIFKDNVGPVTAVFVSEPEEIRKIFSKEGKYPVHIKPEAWLVYNKKYECTRGLFFMDDEEWLNYRRKMNKLLLKGDLTWIEDCCEASNELLLNQIARSSGEQYKDLERALYKWSMDTIISVLMGADSYRINHKNIESLAMSLADDVKEVFETTCRLQLIPATMAAKYNISRWSRFESTVTKALKTANEMLDLLDRYARMNDGLLAKMRAEGIEEDKIRTIVVDLLLGAGDTTSNTMIWALYLLGRNSAVQDSLRKDLSISVLRNTIKETLRLYPAAPFLTRVLPEMTEVGGYQIPKHTLVVMSIYTSGRDERFFKNPEKFIPTRWCRENTPAFPLQQNASLPFGIRARSCVGRKIAEAQLQGGLGKILKEYKVQLCDENEIQDILEMITKPEKPVRIAFVKI